LFGNSFLPQEKRSLFLERIGALHKMRGRCFTDDDLFEKPPAPYKSSLVCAHGVPSAIFRAHLPSNSSAKALKVLATPAGFEPATLSLEG
jgi:hypothetical protein